MFGLGPKDLGQTSRSIASAGKRFRISALRSAKKFFIDRSRYSAKHRTVARMRFF
jgi:hypothetical protein